MTIRAPKIQQKSLVLCVGWHWDLVKGDLEMMNSYLPNNWNILTQEERLEYQRSAENLLDRLRDVIRVLENYQENDICHGWGHLREQLDTLRNVTELHCIQLDIVIDQINNSKVPPYVSPFTGKFE